MAGEKSTQLDLMRELGKRVVDIKREVHAIPLNQKTIEATLDIDLLFGSSLVGLQRIIDYANRRKRSTRASKLSSLVANRLDHLSSDLTMDSVIEREYNLAIVGKAGVSINGDSSRGKKTLIFFGFEGRDNSGHRHVRIIRQAQDSMELVGQSYTVSNPNELTDQVLEFLIYPDQFYERYNQDKEPEVFAFYQQFFPKLLETE